MKKTCFFIILSLLGLSLISSHLFATTRGIRVTAKTGQSLYLYKNYHALVVGVSNYEKWPRLPNAVNDAKEVASKLKELGFEVKLILDPTSREMKTVLNEMVYKMGTEENRALLFYYAGHGETETLADKTKMGYIIPRDCPILDRDPLGFATHAISMREIESASMRIKSKHVLMLFDSCFSGSLFALVRAVPDDITEKSALPVRQYITAGREDEQVPDKSMFKRCFLIGLEGDADLTGDGYITGSELGMYLSDKVVNYTHRRQHPQYGKINNPDLDRGDFIFALKAPPKQKEPVAAAPPQPPQVVEKPQDELDQLLAKIKEKKEAKQRARDALVRDFKRLLQDLEKYKKIESSNLDEATKLAAWGVLTKRYPQWSKGVEPGDSNTLVNRALAGDMDGSLLKVIEEQGKQTRERRLASIPEEVKQAVVPKVKLRDIPKELWTSDIRKMIKERNFFVRRLNEAGDFPNDLVDNGDGTVTDRATGLMWQKGGSLSELYYPEAEKYVSRLNEEKSSGYNDWRIPTVEELCSLLERDVNERAQHMSAIFHGKQSVCWSTDRHEGNVYDSMCRSYNLVNFTRGEIDETPTKLDAFCYNMKRCSIKAVRTVQELKAQRAPEEHLASIPEEVKEAVVHKVTLRDIPEELWDADVKKMVENHNFFVKGLNEDGDFPNDFVDNGDGTVTDRATGLMWQKGGSLSELYYRKAEKYISRLNKERFLGYDDWRIPSLEELCSLLEPAVNERVQHISPLFDGKQSVCWSADRGERATALVLEMNHIVNFTVGEIEKGVTFGGFGDLYPEPHFIRAVRAVK